MNARDLAFLTDMRDAATRALETASKSPHQVPPDDLDLLQSIIYSLIVLGEAANRITTEATAEYPQIPWVQLRGTRNRLAHGYDDLDLAVIRRILEVELPTLLRQLNEIIAGNDLAGPPTTPPSS